ncbi:adenosine receptor A1-like [Pocillopora verrucosa]|uniref:adenosine receptor A1-like n=1 Tax=Pocillopora verrucosa TaxID=203993 RepID=UPI00333F0FB8
MDFNSWNIFWGICFGVLVTLIIAGNVLTIWIFFKQRRQKRSYSLLISLAVADLLVGIFAVPFYIKVVVSQGYTWYVISTGADVFTGTTSIYTLAVISLERMYAVGWPLRHRTVNYRVYVCAISIPWIIAAIVTTLVVLRISNIIGKEYFFYYLVLIPGVPLITICVVNFVIWKKQKTPFRDQNHIKREVKLAKTLALVTGTSLFTWLPFQILNILFALKVTQNFHLIELTLFIIKFLQFSNSVVNVIIYPFRIPEFKRTLFQILNFCVIPFGRLSIAVSPSAGNGSFSQSNVHQESSL